MKVLIHSNAPFIGSGYGVQTDILARALQTRGHEVILSGFHGHFGVVFNIHGMPLLPASAEQWGNDIILSHYEHYRPDVFFMLMDSWVLKERILDAMPATIWAPVDSTPISYPVVNALQHMRWTVAMSRHGEQQMRFAGLDPFYVPHMVETNVYTPIDRTQARAAYGFTEGQFVAVCVAANKGYPPRKHLDRLLRAWSHFIQQHPGGVLYLHTNPYTTHGGVDLMDACRFYDLRFHEGELQPGETLAGYNVVFPDQYRMIRGDYGTFAMNNLYNAADVFVLPSGGEGFGIPVIEAQAAGCPVVVSDFTALHELGAAGYRLPIDPVDDLIYTLHGTHQCAPKVSEIVRGLEWGLEHRGGTALREKARAFALDYDAERVMNRYMLPAFDVMAQGNADYMQFQHYRNNPARRMTAPAPVPNGLHGPAQTECEAKGHDWSPTAVWDKGELCAPCRRVGCEAELRVARTGGQRIVPDGFKSQINGIPLVIEDDPQGGVAKIIMREIEKDYDLDSIPFEAGDVAIDIGAHVGIVSIYLAKKHPDITVYAYEPMPQNFERLKRNLAANGIENVKAFNKAVGKEDQAILHLHSNLSQNSGGSSAFVTGTDQGIECETTNLAAIMREISTPRIRLLKIDCEGAEYPILKSAGDLLARIDHLRGEFHTNAILREQFGTAHSLTEMCKRYIPDVEAHVCEISA